MRSLNFSRCALSISTAALLAACGESQQPIGAPGSMPQSGVIDTQAKHGGSWMLPEAKGEDLIYASRHLSSGCDRDCAVYVYSLHTGKAVGVLRGLHDPLRLCSDAKGNIWVTEDLGEYGVGPGRIIEYAHAGTKPIATLTESDPPTACSVQTSTGNLAVANENTYSHVLAVFLGGRGKPTFYSGASTKPSALTYDNDGDIFMADVVSTYAAGVDWLPKGGSTIQRFLTKPRVYPSESLLWYGRFLTVNGRHLRIGRYTVVNDKSGKEVGTTELYGAANFFIQYWIADKLIIATGRDGIQMWAYPAGGNLVRTINLSDPFGVTASIATGR